MSIQYKMNIVLQCLKRFHKLLYILQKAVSMKESEVIGIYYRKILLFVAYLIRRKIILITIR